MLVASNKPEIYTTLFRSVWRECLFRGLRYVIYSVARKYYDTRGESVVNLEKIF